jgi:hypothetical protein
MWSDMLFEIISRIYGDVKNSLRYVSFPSGSDALNMFRPSEVKFIFLIFLPMDPFLAGSPFIGHFGDNLFLHCVCVLSKFNWSYYFCQ